MGRKPFLLVGAVVIALSWTLSFLAAVAGRNKIADNEPITTVICVLTLVIACAYGFSTSGIWQSSSH